MSTVASWPAYVFHKPDGLPSLLRNAISAEAKERDQSLADTIRGVLCSHYRLDCPPRSKSYQPDRDQGATKMVLRLQPALFQEIKDDAQERGLTLRLVILGILLDYYESD